MGRESRPEDRGLILGAAAVLVAAAAPSAQTVVLIECRMSECQWSRDVSRTLMAANADGQFVRYVTLDATSAHPNDVYPDRFSPRLHLRWKRTTSYAFCSKSRPAFVFEFDLDGRHHWFAHLLDLTNLYGYNAPSAVAYMRACHGLGGSGANLERLAKQLGYHGGTPSQQIELAKPSDILDRAVVMGKVAAASRYPCGGAVTDG